MWVGLALIASACGSTAPTAPAEDSPAATRTSTAATFASLRERPPLLRQFLQEMPKGGDLHTHLSGAVYAERYLDWAIEDGLCVDPEVPALASPPCDEPLEAAASYLRDPRRRSALVDSLSTRNLDKAPSSGHDQFFRSFAKYSAIPMTRDGDMLADVVRRAADQNVSYLEIMKTFASRAVKGLGKTIPWDPDLERMHERVLAAGLEEHLAAADDELRAAETRFDELLGCKGESPEPGCAVTVRYIQQTTRVLSPAQVFTQLTFAFELVRHEPKVVSLNLVAPEDDPVALRDYSLHMRMVGFLSERYPDVPVTLHAGELALGLVPPRELRFHIGEAVEVAKARRVGHAVDVGHERNALELIRRMADDEVLVEVLLTSNDVILGVRGERHPLLAYLGAGIPVALATDDEAVSRTDLTNEFQRAAETYPSLGYDELKRFARHSLTYSFLSGASLWRDRRRFDPVSACAGERLGGESPTASCRAHLDASEKARHEWALEAAFSRFEARDWRSP